MANTDDKMKKMRKIKWKRIHLKQNLYSIYLWTLCFNGQSKPNIVHLMAHNEMGKKPEPSLQFYFIKSKTKRQQLWWLSAKLTSKWNLINIYLT